MDIIDCINSRRSGRSYKDKPISKETLQELIVLGTKAPTGSYEQPWGFVVLQDQTEIDQLSEDIKKYIAGNIESFPYFKQYESWMTDSSFHVFYHASTVLIIYGNTKSHWYIYDCSLMAENIMLSAYSKGIATCWIGFSEYMCNTKEFKEKHNVPAHYELVCPLSMGYSNKDSKPPKRKEPMIFNQL